MSQANTDTSTDEPVRSVIEEVSDGLFELEPTVLRLRNLAYATRMLATSDEMQEGPGAALDSVADTLVNELNALEIERDRLWGLSRERISLQNTKAGAA